MEGVKRVFCGKGSLKEKEEVLGEMNRKIRAVLIVIGLFYLIATIIAYSCLKK